MEKNVRTFINLPEEKYPNKPNYVPEEKKVVTFASETLELV